MNKGMKNLYAILGIAVVAGLVIAAGSWYASKTPNTPFPGIGDVPVSVATSTVVSTTTEVVVQYKTVRVARPSPSNASNAAPTIDRLMPFSGTVGTTVTITGTGFSRIKNYIFFGPSGGRRHPDGTPDNVIAVVPSTNGTSISFTVPPSGPAGVLCDVLDRCVNIVATANVPGAYPVSVSNGYAASNATSFVITTQQ